MLKSSSHDNLGAGLIANRLHEKQNSKVTTTTEERKTGGIVK